MRWIKGGRARAKPSPAGVEGGGCGGRHPPFEGIMLIFLNNKPNKQRFLSLG